MVLSLAGCAGQRMLGSPVGTAEYRVLKVGDIVETRTGRTIAFEALMAELSKAQIIYAGEIHTSIEDHRIQERIFKGLYVEDPSLILAMEMLPREAQPVLDRYCQGLITDEMFLKEVDWERVWGYPFPLYRPLLNWAREKRIRAVGLNAPNEVVRKVATGGLSSLAPSERERLAADFHLDDPKHREYVRKQYVEHLKDKIKGFDTFYEAQLAWEETMAETLARWLVSPQKANRILVVVGKGHFSDGVGIPDLTWRRVKHTYKTIAPVPVDYPGNAVNPDIADYVWITDKAEPHHRGRLGIMAQPLAAGDGLEVMGVAPNSPAAKAGVIQGDIIYMIDGKIVRSIAEVQTAVAGKAKTHEIKLKRSGRIMSLTVSISP